MNFNPSILFLILSFVLTGCFRTAQQSSLPFDKSSSDNIPVTSDIDLSGKSKGKSSHIKILGLISLGDTGHASYVNDYIDATNNHDIYKSKSSAVYNALQGKSDTFLFDPQFRTKEKNFLLFKTTSTEVSGQLATKSNYRQVKRFNTDNTDTVPLEHTFTISRGGRQSSTITASNEIPAHVTQSISVIDANDGIQNVSVSKSNSLNLNSLQTLENKLRANRLELESLLNENNE